MLIQDHSTFIANIETNIAIDFESIKPSLAYAERKYIIPFISKDYYDSITGNVTGLDDVNLKNILISAVANFAIALYIPISEVQITDQGAKRSETENMKSGYKYQVTAAVNNYLDRGYSLIEDAVSILQEKSHLFPVYEFSPLYQETLKRIIKSSQTFAKIATHVNRPHLLYSLLRNTIYNVEQLYIKPTITQDVYDAIRVTNHEPISDMLYSAIVYKSIAQGYAMLYAQVDDTGVNTVGKLGDGVKSSNTIPADAFFTNFSIKESERIAEQWLNLALKEIANPVNTGLWPSFFANLKTTESNKFFNSKSHFSL